MMHRICKVCNQDKPLTDFHKDASYTLGVRSTCKTCIREKNKPYLEANRAIAAQKAKDRYWSQPNARRIYSLERNYHLTVEQVDELVILQGGCATCGSKDLVNNVDHDHTCCPTLPTCGKCIRGILCNRCNLALGLVNDNVHTLASMITYLGGSNV